MINKKYIFSYGGIGLKKLTDADLGISRLAHQTHIGLQRNALTLEKEEFYTKLVYENSYFHGISTINLITRKNGKEDAPKLRIGDDSNTSTCQKIRDLCSNQDIDYHIVYVQTAIDEVHFVLFDSDSELFNKLVEILGYNPARTMPWNPFKSWTENQKVTVGKLLYTLIEIPEKDHEKEIEDLILSGQTVIPRTVKEEDFEKVRASCQETGRKGEELLNNYLINQRNSQYIKDFVWFNENHESYKPYDFKITEISGRVNYVDAKTTKHSFEQPFYMSLREIEFSLRNPYSIYRLYNIESSAKCNKTNKISTLGTDFLKNYTSFKNMISSKDYSIGQINIKFQPDSHMLEFDEVSL